MGQHLSGLFDRRARVACLGDSITYGFGLPDRESECYPSKLQSLLKTNSSSCSSFTNSRLRGPQATCSRSNLSTLHRQRLSHRRVLSP